MSVVVASAPARVELLGNHTDYNQGVALAAAIDRELTVSGTSRSDDRLSLTSSMRVELSLGEIKPQTQQPWANYPLGVIAQFQRAGYKISGFDAQISSNIPIGAGLSSSAAFEVATAGFLMKLHGFRIDPLAVAKLCQRAENEFVGVQSGLLDQATSVFGRADHLVYLDFQTEQVRAIPFPRGYVLVIADSGGKHSLVESQYNARREECAAATKALGLTSLSQMTVAQLEEKRAVLDPLLHRRAAHIVRENDRVRRALEALDRDDAMTIGRLMNASHESSRVNFENSSPELDRLVSIAQALPGVLGSRLTGGGFGGSTVSLVRQEHADAVAESLRAQATSVFICRVADGAAVSWQL